MPKHRATPSIFEHHNTYLVIAIVTAGLMVGALPAEPLVTAGVGLVVFAAIAVLVAAAEYLSAPALGSR